MALMKSRSSKLLTPLLMAGLGKERGRERGLWLPRLAHTDSPTAVAEGREERKVGEKLNRKSAHRGARLLSQFPCSQRTGLSDIKEAVDRPTG